MPQVNWLHVEEFVTHAFLKRVEKDSVEILVNLRGWVFHKELHAEDEFTINLALFAFSFSIFAKVLAA